ncbi:MAG: hypothetical protein ABIS01_18195 [Ferruginibacter sp.]
MKQVPAAAYKAPFMKVRAIPSIVQVKKSVGVLATTVTGKEQPLMEGV